MRMTSPQGGERRVAIVTGAAKQTGIGRATALALSASGAAVVVADIEARGMANRHESPLEAGEESWSGLASLVEEIVAGGGVASMVLGDVSLEAEARRIVESAIASHGRLDILANVAGAPRGPESGDIEGVTTDAWDRVMAVNARGSFLMCREAVKYMRQRRWGRIINLSSDVAIKGGARRVAYAASKAALLGLTRALASDVAESGITVNAILPGWIATSRVTSFVRAQGVDDVEAELDRQAQNLLLRRIGRPSDIAAMIAFLASDEAEWITGQDFVVDGGGVGNG
jgi:3-oxoacyl-[acyl-carrier protein] reductase